MPPGDPGSWSDLERLVADPPGKFGSFKRPRLQWFRHVWTVFGRQTERIGCHR